MIRCALLAIGWSPIIIIIMMRRGKICSSTFKHVAPKSEALLNSLFQCLHTTSMCVCVRTFGHRVPGQACDFEEFSVEEGGRTTSPPWKTTTCLRAPASSVHLLPSPPPPPPSSSLDDYDDIALCTMVAQNMLTTLLLLLLHSRRQDQDIEEYERCCCWNFGIFHPVSLITDGASLALMRT